MYKNVVWSWDDFSNCIVFMQKDAREKEKLPSRGSRYSTTYSSVSGRKNLDAEIQILDTVDAYTQIIYKKLYQRKTKSNESCVATIQDVKDVAIFTSKVEDLTPEFISYFHSAAMDRFLRSMIIYFQYYLQVWNKMQTRRNEESRKLRQPIVTILEDEVRDNLADLRSMVSRDYAAILLGIGDAKRFHHMNNKNNDSLSDKDRRLFETLCFMVVKVIWIALFRKNLSLIEKETNRLLRSLWFSPIEHAAVHHNVANPEENRVLVGAAFTIEKKLLDRSPAIKEIIHADHDHRMLAIGINEIHPMNERIKFLELAYAAPEELLVENNVGVGVLGVERKYLDVMLKPIEISTTVKRHSFLKAVEFNLPPKSGRVSLESYEQMVKKPCKYQETQATKETRKNQCKLWRTYVMFNGKEDLHISVSAPTASIAPSTNNKKDSH